MSRHTLRNLLATVVGAISIGVVFFGVVVLTRAEGSSFIGGALAWLVPVVAGVVVGGVAWAMLAPARISASARERCAHCGALVLEGWRICPHCGHRFDEVREAAEHAVEQSAVA